MHYAMRTVHYLLFLSLGMSLSNAQVASAETYEAGILSRSYISDIQRQIIGRSAYGNVQEKPPVKREEMLQKNGRARFYRSHRRVQCTTRGRSKSNHGRCSG
jgi:hypothetical protein